MAHGQLDGGSDSPADAHRVKSQHNGASQQPTSPPPHTPFTPTNEDEDILNILPSYQMYKSTVSRNLTPSQENFKVDPPMYELTPLNSGTLSPFGDTPLQSPAMELSAFVSEDSSFADASRTAAQPILSAQTFTDESENLWENTVLANAHKLKNLTGTENQISNNLQISITVTEKVGQKGVAPVFMDPLVREFRQGEYIHGYVTITNTSTTPIPFDMVYVVFEGSTIVLDNVNGIINTKTPLNVYKYLNMIDLFASWSYANIDRLASDNGDPHDWCDGETDPYDNTTLAIDVKRLFQPGVRYKRFFTFKVPEKLLDDACEMHDLTLHQEVPPSFGTPRMTGRQDSNGKSIDSQDSQKGVIRDFCFIDASMSYSVDARVIGKASDYRFKTSSLMGDEYVIAKEASLPIRVIPMQTPERNARMIGNRHEANQYYRAFVDCIKTKINAGRELLNLQPITSNSGLSSGYASPRNLTPMPSQESMPSVSFVKLRQLYDNDQQSVIKKLRVPRKSINEEQYQSFLTYKKKSLTGLTKSCGILTLSTPKTEYRMPYKRPAKFVKEGGHTSQSTISIPMELQFFAEEGKSHSLPEIKDFSAELTVFTVKSKKHPIPIEITHELLFHDQEVESSKRLGNDNFDAIVIIKFREYLYELRDLLKRNGPNVLLVETGLFNDLKSMALLQTKYIHLSVDKPLVSDVLTESPARLGGLHPSLSSIQWNEEKSPETAFLQGYTAHSKRFSLNVDLLSLDFKAGGGNKNANDICLVPDFQTCLLVRLHYLKVSLKTTTNQIMTVNVPIICENAPM
jgi:hypothetical protein